MSAPKNNRFWKARSSHGRKPKFAKPHLLWNACVEYFNWTEDNPLKEEKVFHSAGTITKADVNHIRAMTESGLCIFLDIGQSTWDDYKHKQDFSEVTTRVSRIIYNQKFAGAAADMLNANIIARDLGLKDKKDIIIDAKIKSTSKQITSEMSQEEATKLYQDMLDD